MLFVLLLLLCGARFAIVVYPFRVRSLSTMEESNTNLIALRATYQRAVCSWKSNDLLVCIQICAELTRQLNFVSQQEEQQQKYNSDIFQLRQLVWFLKIRCLSEDNYVNESLLLNENDINSDSGVQTFTATRQSTACSTARHTNTATGANTVGVGRRMLTGKVESRHQRTAILTGRMPSASSRQSGRATTAYRPLTTSLTATQTAFSRSTRPLLKYAASRFLAKQLYEYLYSVQNVANKCPDYRQCLEYINLIRTSIRKSDDRNKAKTFNKETSLLVSMSENTEFDEQKCMGSFWLLAYGVCYFHLNMNKQAGEYFRLAQAADPKYLAPYTWLIKVYLRLNQPVEVLKTCQLGITNSKNTILFNWMARVQSLLSDSFAANQSLRNSLQFNPTNIEALANVGYFSFYGDKVEQSLKCFERINQLSLNNSYSNSSSGGYDEPNIDSSTELLNNLALCNFYCGRYDKVIPSFQRAFLNSPSKEITSCIWYNISFVPLSCGAKNLAIACLKLALMNDSQNEEALNNFGILKYGELIDDENIHYMNKQETWANNFSKSKPQDRIELENFNDQRKQQVLFDTIETYFKTLNVLRDDAEDDEETRRIGKPEMLFNMAMVKKKRGQFLSAVQYLEEYLIEDSDNYSALKLLDEIRELVSFDC